MKGRTLSLAVDPGEILAALGMPPDPWQRRFLVEEHRYTLLCCTRGGGKSRASSAKALHRALFLPNSLVLLVSRSQRQSLELFRYVKQGYAATGRVVRALRENETTLELANGSRIVSLPGTEETIRGLQGVSLILIDEAARVPDTLYRAVRPMLGVARGQLIALSTPFGQRGWFWDSWANGGDDWNRVRVPWTACPRLSQEFIDTERRACGESWVRQEFECSFESMTGVVYPDFASKCATDELPPVAGRLVGGIDFGYRNPFAAVWGFVDATDVLWIVGERYAREKGLHDHIAGLPAGVTWHADPAHPTEILALCRAGLTVRKGQNAIKAGIAAVRARIETGRLKVLRTECPNLVAEAGKYHYDPDEPTEVPVDADNHALAALRYLVSRVDHDFLSRFLRRAPAEVPEPPTADPERGWSELG